MESEKYTGNNKDIEVLIVEDSPTQVAQLQYSLEKHDYSVSVASNGNEALASIRKRKPTIIIADIVMPEMNGYDLCHQIKNDETLKDIPVILLTTLSDPMDIIKGLECGANNFITKPYKEDLLFNRIQYIVMNKKIREGNAAEIGIDIFFKGRKYRITSDRMQILDLLLSSFETAVQKNEELQLSNKKLRDALDTVRTLGGLIPICANCKKIRNDKGFWQQVEEYISQHSEANFTHSICPECSFALYPEFHNNRTSL